MVLLHLLWINVIFYHAMKSEQINFSRSVRYKQKIRPHANKIGRAYVATLCWFGDNTSCKHLFPAVWFAWLLVPDHYGHLTELTIRTHKCTLTLAYVGYFSWNMHWNIVSPRYLTSLLLEDKTNIDFIDIESIDLVQVRSWCWMHDRPLCEWMWIL